VKDSKNSNNKLNDDIATVQNQEVDELDNGERERKLENSTSNDLKKKRPNILLKVIIVIVVIGVLGIIALTGINLYVTDYAKKTIITENDAAKLKDIDCIIVLGCAVKDGDRPSDMLEDRLKRGIALYKNGTAPKILMSGDHGRKSYDEVNTMKRVAIENGIPSSDVFMDHAGFSTYETMYRARDVFEAKKVVIVTQKYHLYRSVYCAKKLGMEAYGVDSDYRRYYGQSYRDTREVLARVKDFITTIYKPEPTYLGEVISIKGDGNKTND